MQFLMGKKSVKLSKVLSFASSVNNFILISKSDGIEAQEVKTDIELRQMKHHTLSLIRQCASTKEMSPTKHFTISEPRNPPITVSELLKIPRLTEFSL